MSHSLSRRDVMKLIGAGMLAPACKWLPDFGSKTPPEELIFSGYRVGEPFVNKDAGFHIGGSLINKRIQLKNEIHSILHSEKLDMKVFIPKLETHAYVQVGNGEIKPFTATPGNYFYGHGVIDEARGLLYTTQAKITADRQESARRSEQGFIHVHTLPDLKEINSFSSYGFDPHDMMMSENKLVVCNGGKNSSVSIIEMDTRKLVKDYVLGNDKLSLRHIDRIDPDHFVIATLSLDDDQPSSLYDLNVRDGFRNYQSSPMIDKTLLFAQVLSVKVHGNYVYGTCPSTDSLVVWEAHREFIGGVAVPVCNNLSWSPNYNGMIVGSGQAKEPARLVQIESGKLKFRQLPELVDLTGAHSLLISG